MTHTLLKSAKPLAVAASIVFGMFVFTAPIHAAEAVPGDLIKCPDFSAVYHYAEDGKRYVFQNDRTFFTWEDDFSKVKTVSCEDLSTLPIGGIVPYRAGTKLVKIPTDPRVYAVLPNKRLRPIQSEEQARKLYGEDWAERVEDLNESFFTQYIREAALEEDELPEGFLLEDEDGGVLQVDESGEAVEITDIVEEEDVDRLRGLARAIQSIEANIAKILERLDQSEVDSETRRTRATEALEKVIVRLEEIAEKRAFEVGEDALDALGDAEERIAKAENRFADFKTTDASIDLTLIDALISESQTTLEEARTAYHAERFGEAERLAEQAEESAKKALSLMDDDEEEMDNEDEAEDRSEDREEASEDSTADAEADEVDEENEADESDAVDDVDKSENDDSESTETTA